jgi:hypothetical protein
MTDEEFVLDTGEEPLLPRGELTGWEDVVFELADEETDGD